MKNFLIFLVISSLVIFAGWYYYQTVRVDTAVDNSSAASLVVETEALGQARLNPFAESLNPFRGYQNPFQYFLALSSSTGFAVEATKRSFNALHYPIFNLGNCAEVGECETYCNQPANIIACTDFAEQRALLSPKMIADGRTLISLLTGGQLPSDCRTVGECETYCQGGVRSVRDCLRAVEKANFLAPEALTKLRQTVTAFTGGDRPGACQTWADCRTYCADTANLNTCLDFAVKAGVISPEDAAIIRPTD